MVGDLLHGILYQKFTTDRNAGACALELKSSPPFVLNRKLILRVLYLK